MRNPALGYMADATLILSVRLDLAVDDDPEPPIIAASSQLSKLRHAGSHTSASGPACRDDVGTDSRDRQRGALIRNAGPGG
jgi:hypothetical protein